MKKSPFTLLVIIISPFILGFGINSELNLPNQSYKDLLIGKWKLILVSNDKMEINFNQFSECRKKDYIVYTDSMTVEYKYGDYKNECAKSVRKNKYKLELGYFSSGNYSIITRGGYQYTGRNEILVLNDSILKISPNYRKTVYTYKKQVK